MTLQGFIDQALVGKPTDMEEATFLNDFDFNLNGQPVSISNVEIKYPEEPKEGEPEVPNPPQPTIEITLA